MGAARFDSHPGFFLLCMFSLERELFFSGYSGFLPPSEGMNIRLAGDSKLSVTVNVRVNPADLSP